MQRRASPPDRWLDQATTGLGKETDGTGLSASAPTPSGRSAPCSTTAAPPRHGWTSAPGVLAPSQDGDPSPDPLPSGHDVHGGARPDQARLRLGLGAAPLQRRRRQLVSLPVRGASAAQPACAGPLTAGPSLTRAAAARRPASPADAVARCYGASEFR